MPDCETAQKYFRLSGENGSPASYNDLGWILIENLNDYETALKSFERGYDLGDKEYCGVARGDLYCYGDKTTNPLYDIDKALEIYEQCIAEWGS